MKNQTSPLAPRRQRDYAGVLSSILAILAGLLVGLIVLLATNPSNAFPAFSALITGGFYSGMKTFGNVLYYAVPIIMTGLGVGFGFKASIFNIGGAGQFIVGAFCGVYTASIWNLPGALGWIVPLLASMIGGALWALLPGLLHAYRRVNIVIATIMMNYIGMYLVNFLTVLTVYDFQKNQSLPVAAGAVAPKLGLDKIFSYNSAASSVNAGIFIAIAMGVVVYYVLEKTSFGYELKACGYNRDAAKYAGINETRSIILSMVIAGALSGLGGACLYLAGAGKGIEVVDTLAAEGFNGIPVALLGLNNPLGIILAGIFIAYLTQGGFQMQLWGFAPQVIDIIIAVIIYFSAFALILRSFVQGRRKKGPPRKKTAATQTAPPAERREGGAAE